VNLPVSLNGLPGNDDTSFHLQKNSTSEIVPQLKMMSKWNICVAKRDNAERSLLKILLPSGKFSNF
jgi:hypothetical protein